MLSCLLLLAGPAASSEPEPAAAGEIVRLTEEIAVKDGQSLRVVNHLGNVRIREVPLASSVELALTVQTEPGAANPVRPSIEMRDDGVLEFRPASEGSQESFDGVLRIDLTLAVPDRVELDVELAEGDFTMHGASYPVRLRADRGTVRVRTSGEVDVEVTEGHVVYLPPRGVAPAGGRIATSGAPVDVLMNDPRLLAFEVLSGAAVTTDSPWLLNRREVRGRTAHFGGDEADATLAIRTDAAPVRLVFEGIR
ncbi:hypothetical protein [Halomonas denitrificans]|nr:hypothetical protein [Halomonas denitrificans]